MENTSWQKVGGWYKKIVGVSGHFYHQSVILPNLFRLLKLKNEDKIIDIGCGQGIVGRLLTNEYVGIDNAANLIEEAKKLDKNPRHRYVVADATKKMTGEKFDKAIMVLSVQNISRPFLVFKNCSEILKKEGRLFLVINHPCFRIPKHSDWLVKDDKQWRMMDGYMTPQNIPIETSPYDRKNNEISWSFHYPISSYIQMLSENGFVIEKIEEWISPKKSTGKMAKIEDKARAEFPLFMAIVAKKV